MSMQTSGQRLMCVWQAVAMLDPGHSATKSTASKLTVQHITCNLARICPSANYSAPVFMDNFPNASVDFNDYVNYVKVCLRDHSGPMATLEDEFEVNCWEMCKDCYSLHHCSMQEAEVMKMWQIFNRLCLPGTIPPVMEYDDVQWLGAMFAKGAKQRWSSYHDGQLTFMEVLLDLDAACFKVLSHGEVEQVVDSVHGWLVKEVCRTGWMSKRTRKQANWTSWQKRWFVLKPGLLSYYTTSAMTEKKGDIIITTRSRVDDLGDLKTLIRHYPNRFRITNAPFIEIELSNEVYTGKDDWMRSVKLVIKAQTAGISPSECLLMDIRKVQTGERVSVEETHRSYLSMGRRGKSDGFSDETDDEIDGARHSGASNSTGNLDEDSDVDQERRETRAEHSSWCIPFVMTRTIELANHRGDDGIMSDTGFKMFLHDLGILLPESSGKRLFEELNDNGSVSVKAFVTYLLKVLLFTKAPDDSVSQHFLRASLRAYEKSQCLLNFTDFTEALWRKQRIYYVHLIMQVLDGLDGQSQDTLTQLRCAFSREQSVLSSATEDKESCDESYEEILHDAMQVNVDQLAQYLYQQWASYPLKTDATEMKPQRVPHDKRLLDIVFYVEPDELMEPPECTRIDMFTWKRASKQGKSGIVLLPNDFDGIVALSEPTPDALLYYGAVCASEDGQLQTTLLYEHNIVNYRRNDEAFVRPCLVRQNVPAIFCPLEDDCGILVLGRQNDQAMELNAFYIPAFTTLYIPAGTLFCTNYMMGMWRSMVIQQAMCDTAHVAREDGKIRFHFRYVQLHGHLV